MSNSEEKDRHKLNRQRGDDPPLSGDFLDNRRLINGLEYYGKEVFKKQLKVIHQEVIESKRARRPLLRPLRIAMSAAAVLLILLTFWFLQPSPSLTAPQIYAAYYQPYSLTLNQRNTAHPQLERAVQFYHKKAYAQALPIFESLVSLNPQNLQVLLACGISCLELDRSQEALRWFEQVLKADDLLYRDAACWYAALAHLKAGEAAAARPFLELLVENTEADYYKSAVKVLNRLK